MTEDGTRKAEEMSPLEVDDEAEEAEEAENQSDTSGASSASAPYSTTGRSQYGLAP